MVCVGGSCIFSPKIASRPQHDSMLTQLYQKKGLCGYIYMYITEKLELTSNCLQNADI